MCPKVNFFKTDSIFTFGALIDWKLKNNNKTQMTFLIYSLIGIDKSWYDACYANHDNYCYIAGFVLREMNKIVYKQNERSILL